ncbi:response regulator [Rhizobium leguminosarum]|uniref:winged helix-turn-helix domain-containing protein n=1 Tax=Rhizobium leguminosarum TaxID=384 RepID=UPI001C944210|nr:winged helix-turn-helix domain-containing protein [Rhizobium leguminosarum]MBY5538279.1 response regulator [Rhizobium leguminosarum]
MASQGISAPLANGSDFLPFTKSVSTKKRVLLLSADREESASICLLLRQHGFDAAFSEDSIAANDPRTQDALDLLIVDLNIGRDAALSFVDLLSPDLPVVLISDEHHREADKVRGLERGAEDYIDKPFGPREFIARLRVCLRPPPAIERGDSYSIYSFDGWSLNTRLRTLKDGSGAPTKLSTSEFNILIAFLERPGTVMSREEVLDATRVHSGEVCARSVDVSILRLRRKVETCNSGGFIATVRGKGYVFTREVEVRNYRL